MVKVSIIVPVYNVETYLVECLDSAVNQTLDDIEIICINDGSTDGSKEILTEYKQRYNNLTVIEQENKGLGATRNIGMTKAKGKYIYFLDSDDFIELNAMELCYEKCEEEELDFVTFDCNTFYEEDYTGTYRHKVDRSNILKSRVYNSGEMFNELMGINNMYYETCFNFFNKDFLSEFNIKYRENLIYEDVVNTVKAYIYASKTSYIEKKLYNRRVRNNSIMTKKKTKENIRAHYICANELYELYKSKDFELDYKIRLSLKRCISNFYSYSISNSYLLNENKYRKSIVKSMRNNKDLKDIYLDILIDCPTLLN